jgi:pimeloyl-ACP methyl ester carboxylesterase
MTKLRRSRVFVPFVLALLVVGFATLEEAMGGIPSTPPTLIYPADNTTVPTTTAPLNLRQIDFVIQPSSPGLGHSWEVYRNDSGVLIHNGIIGGNVTTFPVRFNANLAGVLLCWRARVDLPMSEFSSPACFRFTAGGTPTPTPSPTRTPTVAGLDDRGALTGKQSAPPADDRTFVVDSAATLDTECRYAADGDITFNIPVTRFVGAVNGSNQLLNAPALVSEDVVGPTALLVVNAWDVDADGQQHPDKQPEDDRVFFNNVYVGSLSGTNRAWGASPFTIPIDQVKFPSRGIGAAPSPAMNAVRIEIDKANSSAQRVWCTAVDWAALRIKAMSPIVLIHGNGQSSAFFDKHGFTNPGLVAHSIPHDNSITMVTASIADHAAQLASLLPPIVRSFGADSVHLVAHSKGGLDSRAFLTKYYKPQRSGGEFTVLSLLTLSTPHKGTALLDALVAQEQKAFIQSPLSMNLAPVFGKILWACNQSVDAGRRDLTTHAVATFDAANRRWLPRSTVFGVISADADRDLSGHIEFDVDRVQALADDDDCLQQLKTTVSAAFAARSVDLLYQFLRNTRSMSVQFVPVGAPFLYFSYLGVAVHGGGPNDTLVTVESAEAGGAPFEPVMSFVAADGRNHSTIADTGVAEVAIPFLQDVDRTIGDLR